VEDVADQLSGAARARGMRWAEAVHKKAPAPRPWPAYDGRAADIARRKVAGLSTHDLVLELLAQACWSEAGRRWGQVTRAR